MDMTKIAFNICEMCNISANTVFKYSKLELSYFDSFFQLKLFNTFNLYGCLQDHGRHLWPLKLKIPMFFVKFQNDLKINI